MGHQRCSELRVHWQAEFPLPGAAPINTLYHFLLPTITTLGVRSNEWTTKSADDWICTEWVEVQLRGVNVLSINLIGFSETLLEPLIAHLSCLRELTLRSATPLGLSCRVLKKLCKTF